MNRSIKLSCLAALCALGLSACVSDGYLVSGGAYYRGSGVYVSPPPVYRDPYPYRYGVPGYYRSPYYRPYPHAYDRHRYYRYPPRFAPPPSYYRPYRHRHP